MQYQSLIRFLEYAAIDYSPDTVHNISRIKKQVTAEFALEAGGIITIDDISYTKHEVLTELERHDLPERLGYHRVIWNHKGLLDLLERDALDMNTISSWRSLSQNSGFVSFLSPYFAPAFDSVMKTLLRKNDLYAASVWLDYFLFVEPLSEEMALIHTRLYLDQVIRLFRNLNDQSYRQRLPELRPWFTEYWSVFLNKIPQSLLFYIDDIANAIINFTVRIQKSDRKMCYEISSELTRLEHVNYSLKQLIKSNHDIYKQNYESRTVKGRFSGIPKGYMVVVILIILVRIFSLVNPSRNEDRIADFNNTSITNDFAEQVEKGKYQAIRDFYNHEYGKSKGNVAQDTLFSHTPFTAKNTYFVIEHGEDTSTSLYPYAFRNNTDENIEINMMRGGSVYYLDARSHEVTSFQPRADNNADMILSFGKEGKWSEGSAGDTREIQYIHLAPSASAAAHNIDFTKEDPIELPYLEQAQLDTIPLMIIIHKREGHYFFEIRGKGRIVQFKALPGQA